MTAKKAAKTEDKAVKAEKTETAEIACARNLTPGTKAPAPTEAQVPKGDTLIEKAAAQEAAKEGLELIFYMPAHPGPQGEMPRFIMGVKEGKMHGLREIEGKVVSAELLNPERVIAIRDMRPIYSYGDNKEAWARLEVQLLNEHIGE